MTNELEPKKVFSVDRSFNLGTMLHMVVILVAIVIAWGRFDERTAILEMQVSGLQDELKNQQQELKAINSRTERMEMYLISRDPKYLIRGDDPK